MGYSSNPNSGEHDHPYPAQVTLTGTPVVTGGSALDDDGSATLEAGGTDQKGKLIIETGTAPGSGTICSVNFGGTVPGDAVVILQPENGDAIGQLVAAEILVSHEGGGSFDIDCNNSLDGGKTMWFYYLVV